MALSKKKRDANNKYLSETWQTLFWITLAVLKNKNWRWRLKRMKENSGLTDFSTKTVFVDPRFEIVLTIIHECLHIICPKAAEKSVRQTEEKAARFIKPREAEFILQCFLEALKKSRNAK